MNSSWPVIPLGDVLRHRKEFITIDDLTVYKRPRVSLHAQGVVLRDELPGALIKTKTQQVCQVGEFLVAEIDAKVGGYGIVPDALDGAIVSSHYFLFAIDESRLDRRFLDYFIRTSTFSGQIAAQGSTNYAAIRPAHVLSYKIPLPPLADQQRIVARIETLAADISDAHVLRRQAIEEAEALSHSCAEAAFRRLRDEFGTRTLGDICKTITDGDHNTPTFSDEGVRFIFVGNVSSGRLHFDGSKRVSQEYFKTLKPHRLPQRGDILYTAVGATLGIPAVVDNEEPFCFQRHVAILKPDHKLVDSGFVWHMLRSRTVFDRAWASTTGSAQPTVPLRAIRKLPIPIPPLVEQRRNAEKLDALQSQIERLRQLQADTEQEVLVLLPAVLDRAFKGEL